LTKLNIFGEQFGRIWRLILVSDITNSIDYEKSDFLCIDAPDGTWDDDFLF
jgi:hypothetical protein